MNRSVGSTSVFSLDSEKIEIREIEVPLYE